MAHLRQRRSLPSRQQYLYRYGRYVPVGLRIWSAPFLLKYLFILDQLCETPCPSSSAETERLRWARLSSL